MKHSSPWSPETIEDIYRPSYFMETFMNKKASSQVGIESPHSVESDQIRKEQSSENALAIRKATEDVKALAALPDEVKAGNWGAIEEMEATDLLVPKIYHQQAMSKFVADGLARPGDFCDSLTGQVLATKDSKLEIIVFGSFKTMVISKQEGSGKWELDRIVTIVPENAKEFASKPLTEEINGEQFKNNLQYNFYCLIPTLINELPYVISLGGTKTKAARKLNTMLYKLNQLHRPGASVVFELSSRTEKNDQGSWYGLEITQGRPATAPELLRAHAWHLKSKSQKFVVVEEETAAAQSEPWDNDK